MKGLAAVLALVALLQSLPVAAQGTVTLTLACERERSPDGSFLLSFHNSGQEPTALLLGMSLANGRWYELRDLAVVVKTEDDVQEYQYRSRQFPMGVAGRMDHWVVPLPADASYALTLSPRDLFSPVPGALRVVLSSKSVVSARVIAKPVTYDLNPDMAGLRNLRIFTGTMTSNALTLPEDCKE